MDTITSKAISRILNSCRSQKVVHASDVAAGLRFLLPESSYDEAAVVEHLSFMVDHGYKPPVLVLLT